MHIWRGISTSNVPTIEPAFEVNKNNYTTGIWLAQSIDGNYTELDLYFKYVFQNFSFTIYDYCPTSIKQSAEISNYNKNNTKHTIELNLTYSGREEFPVKILVATMVYGDDINSKTNKNYYSTYFELGYNVSVENNSINLFLGINPFESYYGNDFGIINAGLTIIKSMNINKKLEIPFQASLITNPVSNSLFLNFGFSL